MADLLLHHYDASPFSEKVRTVLGLKGLAWRSVLQPNVMPKPHLVPLTGGYRRIPVLQIGADVYCDTQLIVRVLERRFPEPSLHPHGTEGTAHVWNLWADRVLFMAAVPVLFGRLGPAVPRAFIEDRTKMMGGRLDFDAMMKGAPVAADPLRAGAALLEAQLADGRAFLLGEAPGLADAAAHHPVWFLRGMPPTAGVFDEFPCLLAWSDRVKAIGHGRRSECAPEEALRIAREAKPATTPSTDPRDPNGLRPGERIAVTPDDYAFDPVEGELVASSVHEVALRRSAPEVGEVVVHFPRAGFRVTRT